MQIENKFQIADRVIVDKDGSIIGTVTAIMWRGNGRVVVYEVSWIMNGESKCFWIEEFRLQLKE